MIGVTSSGDRPAISLPNKCREKGVAHPPFSLNLSESPSSEEMRISEAPAYSNEKLSTTEAI